MKQMATFDPSAASRQLPFARGAMGLRESYAVAYVHRLVVGEGVLPLPLAVRRETAARRDWRVNPRFCEPQPKGGRGRPPLQASRSVTQPHNAGQAPVPSPGGKFKAIAQREGSHCQRRHAAALSPGTARRHFAIAKPPKVLYNRLPDFLVNCQLLNIRRSGTNT